MNAYDALKRSIDTLQRLYAVFAALAIGEAMRRTFLVGDALTLPPSSGKLPLCIAVVVTVIPFIHGMNRHLDDHIDDLAERGSRDRMMTAMLILDFGVFVLECCILLILAATINASVSTFVNALATLLFVDIGWVVLQMRGERASPTTRLAPSDKDAPHDDHLMWAKINVPAVAVLLVLSRTALNTPLHYWVIAVLAVARSWADYWLQQSFYFPFARRTDRSAAEPAAS